MKHTSDGKHFFVLLVYTVVVYLAIFSVLREPAPEVVETATDNTATAVEEQAEAMADALEENPMPSMTAEEAAAEKSQATEMMETVESVLATGSFTEVAHPGAGTASLIEKDGKQYVVLSDDFQTDAGPNLHIFLTGSSNPENSTELHAAGDIDLGALKDETGAQVYEVPTDQLDFDPKSVVVYCVPFKVIFTTAELQ